MAPFYGLMLLAPNAAGKPKSLCAEVKSSPSALRLAIRQTSSACRCPHSPLGWFDLYSRSVARSGSPPGSGLRQSPTVLRPAGNEIEAPLTHGRRFKRLPSLKQVKVITVVMATEQRGPLRGLDPTRAQSRAYATHLDELEIQEKKMSAACPPAMITDSSGG